MYASQSVLRSVSRDTLEGFSVLLRDLRAIPENPRQTIRVA